MQTNYIEAFMAVVQNGSLSKASEQLFITQPTLTHRIQALENELGIQLFSRNRGQRAAELTPAGREFLPLAARWLNLADESRQIALERSIPKISVAATQTLCTYVMPHVYSRFVQRGLPVTLDLKTLHFRECYSFVETGQCDAVFVSKAMSSPTVSTFPIYSEKMVLLCSKSAPYCANLNPTDLPRDKCVYMQWSQEYDAWHEYYFNGVKPIIKADSMRLVERVLAVTDYWSIVPISAASAAVKNSELCYYDLNNGPPQRPVYLLTLEPWHDYTKILVEDFVSVLDDLIKNS